MPPVEDGAGLALRLPFYVRLPCHKDNGHSAEILSLIRLATANPDSAKERPLYFLASSIPS